MADFTSISIDLDTAAVVDEIKNITRLSKTEISRQAFSLFLKSIKTAGAFGVSSVSAETVGNVPTSEAVGLAADPALYQVGREG